MRAAIVAVLAVAGCSDPSLQIVVIPVDGFAVDTTTVTAYQSDTLVCSDVELGIATPDVLSAAFVDEAVVERGETLTGVSRTEPKVFVAEARDANGRRVFAGCEQRGEITGDEVVTITTHEVATITVSGDSLDRPFARRKIQVAAVDAVGRPLDQRHVQWTSYGVAGSFAPELLAQSGPNVCTKHGLATLEPADPDTPGPIAAQIRVSWAEVTPPPLSGFIANVTNQIDLREPGSTLRLPPACAVRREATVEHVYCLKRPPQPTDARQLVELDITGNALTVTPVGAPVFGNHLVATNPDDQGDDDLYVVEKQGARIVWTGAAGTPDGAGFQPCDYVPGACAFGAIRRVVVVPSCGVGTGLAVTSFTTGAGQPDAAVFTDLRGQPLVLQPPSLGTAEIDLLAGGCVAEATSEAPLHQAFAVRVTPLVTTQNPYNELIALCGTTACTARWPGFGSVGFSGGATPRLLSSEVDITGNVIVESEIVVAGSGDLALIERGRTATAAQARSLASADVDLDGTEDLAWSQFITDDSGTTANRIQLAVGREGLPFAGRLTGLSPGLPGNQALILFARIDDDDAPDLVTFSDSEVAVYRSGVEVPHEAPAGDETICN